MVVTISSKISSVISNDQLSSGVFISFARLDGPGLLRIMLDSFHFLETFGLSVVHVRTLYFPTLALQIFLSYGTTGSQFRLFKVSDSISNVSFLGTSFLTNRMSSVLFSSASDLLQKLSSSLCLNKIHLSASKKNISLYFDICSIQRRRAEFCDNTSFLKSCFNCNLPYFHDKKDK